MVDERIKCKMILTNGFGPDPRVYKEACSLAKAGYDVEILCWDRELKYPAGDEYYHEGFNVKRFQFASRYGSGLKQFSAYRSFRKAVNEYLSDASFDLLHCHDFDALVVGYGINKDKPIVFDEHDDFASYFSLRGGLVNKIIAFFIRLIQHRISRNISAHIVVTPKMSELYSHETVTITNAPLRETFSEYRNRDDVNGTVVIGFIGNVRYLDKHVEMANIVGHYSNVFYLVAGGGTKAKDLYEYVKLNNLGNVLLSGEYQLEELSSLYSKIDVTHIIYPNDASKISMPNKFFESVVTEKPIICNSGSEIAEIVYNNNFGWLVNNHDELSDLVYRLSKGTANYSEKRASMKEHKDEYFWDYNETKLKQLYKSIILKDNG